MSHADHATSKKIINWVKTLNRQIPYPIPILLDTQGPEIRTGVLANPMELKTGDVVTLSVRDSELVEQKSIQINYDDIVDAVDVGGVITVDNGLMNFKVLQKKQHQLTCEVIDGGTLGSRKHVNLPGVRVNLPAITAKDEQDIKFGIDNDVDFIALSFVRSPDDITQLRTLLGKKQQSVKVIAKIEDQEGVKNIQRHCIIVRWHHGGTRRLRDRNRHYKFAKYSAAAGTCQRQSRGALHCCDSFA